MARKFTAEEMREIADEIGLVHDDIHEKAAAMLYRAADELERGKRYEYGVFASYGVEEYDSLSGIKTLDEIDDRIAKGWETRN